MKNLLNASNADWVINKGSESMSTYDWMKSLFIYVFLFERSPDRGYQQQLHTNPNVSHTLTQGVKRRLLLRQTVGLGPPARREHVADRVHRV